MRITIVYNSARGSITISSDRDFKIYTDNQVIEMSNILSNQPGWVDNDNQLTTVGVSNVMSMNELFRHSGPRTPESTFETGFIDLVNIHNIYSP